MGKNQNSVVVLRIRLKFWWMIPMGVKYNHTAFEQETQWLRPGKGFASGGPSFQNLSKMARKCLFFWHLRVPIRSLERCIGKETDIHMMNTQKVRPTTSLWVQNTAKSALKSTLFAYLFKSHLLVPCFIAMDCIGHPCGD